MPTSLTQEEIEATAKVYVEAGGNLSIGAKMMRKSRSTFQSRVRNIEATQPDLLKLPDVEKTEPKAQRTAAEERSLQDEVKLNRAAADMRATNAKLRDATKLISDMQDRIADLTWAAEASYIPAKWASPERNPGKSEHMPVLLTSDFHCGEVVRADETEAGYGYDSGIFVRRYRSMIDTAILLAFEHVGRNWNFPGIIYERGGDIISGQLHPELIETDDMTPIEAVLLVAEEEMGGIRKLADAFGRVEVKSFAGGNHDRNLFKPTTKGAAMHSYDTLVEYMLRREFKGDKRITFQTSRSFDIRFPIYAKNILLTHGDRTGSRGGQGFIGPAATIMRGVQKVMREQSALGFHIDQVHMGHFHYPMCLPEVISNGSLPGYTEFAKQFRMRPNPPQQALMFFHPRRGMVDYKPIVLTEA